MNTKAVSWETDIRCQIISDKRVPSEKCGIWKEQWKIGYEKGMRTSGCRNPMYQDIVKL